MFKMSSTMANESKPVATDTNKSSSSSSEQTDESKFSSIADSVSNLLNCKEFSDVTFIVGENKKIVYGHKMILSLASPVFKQM